MNGNEAEKSRDDNVWYELRDEMTGESKGYISPDGETRDTDADISQKVKDAFAKDLIVKDDEVAAELGGVCFDGVSTIAPNDPGHNRMVLQNLGALTGLRPSRAGENDNDSGTPERK